jgi:glycine/D-amino acid oxidase-like deaminating enzyme
MHKVIVIGTGTTGAAASYHLANHGICNILVLDMGLVGRSLSTPGLVPTTTIPGLLGPHPPLPCSPGMLEEEEEEEEASYKPENSGSAVFDCGHGSRRRIKMMVTLPATLPKPHGIC